MFALQTTISELNPLNQVYHVVLFNLAAGSNNSGIQLLQLGCISSQNIMIGLHERMVTVNHLHFSVPNEKEGHISRSNKVGMGKGDPREDDK